MMLLLHPHLSKPVAAQLTFQNDFKFLMDVQYRIKQNRRGHLWFIFWACSLILPFKSQQQALLFPLQKCWQCPWD